MSRLPIYILLWSHCVGDLLSVDAVNGVQRQLHYEPMHTAVLIDLSDALQDLSTCVCVYMCSRQKLTNIS